MDTIVKRYNAIDSRYIVQAVDGAGSNFFSRSAMSFFSSRLAGSGWRIDIGNGDHIDVLVTSERDKYRDSNPREYTVRVFIVTDHGRAVEIKEDSEGFGGYVSSRSARVAAGKLVYSLANGGGWR